MLKTLLTLICLLLAACPGGMLLAAPLPDFSASYELRLGSLRIGSSTISLENGTDGSYVYESRSTPTKLVSWLFKDKLYESSSGTLARHGVRPDRYFYSRSGGSRERKEELNFDWQAMRVSNHVEDSRGEMDIPAGTLDKLASQLAMMLALRDGETDVTFNIADDGKLKEYRFRVVGRGNAGTAGRHLRHREDHQAARQQEARDLYLVRPRARLPAGAHLAAGEGRCRVPERPDGIQ